MQLLIQAADVILTSCASLNMARCWAAFSRPEYSTMVKSSTDHLPRPKAAAQKHTFYALIRLLGTLWHSLDKA